MSFDRNQAGNNLRKAVKRLRNLRSLEPKLGIVLGSGFKGFCSAVEIAERIPYKTIPGFLAPGVKGHTGELLAARLNGYPLLILSGRAHYYEGHSMPEVTFPIRVLAALGIERIVLTNAAGGINAAYRPGDFMVFKDHINFMGANPLRGQWDGSKYEFLDQTAVYDKPLIRSMRKAARAAGVILRAGTYLAVSGPTYETPAEIRAFARLGADAVGMSTVPEAMVARQCGLRIAALSCITNKAAGRNSKPISHDEVLSTGRKVDAEVKTFLTQFVLYSRNA